jgi:hypothetical protein
MPGSRRYPYRADIHARLIEAAATGRTIAYSDLGTSRAVIGGYHYRIAIEENVASRPPLIAVVVHKYGGTGPGFLEAAKLIGYWTSGESETQVWRRALDEVHEYWRPKLSDDPSVDGAGRPSKDAEQGAQRDR